MLLILEWGPSDVLAEIEAGQDFVHAFEDGAHAGIVDY
jgi:hypothetical protein